MVWQVLKTLLILNGFHFHAINCGIRTCELQRYKLIRTSTGVLLPGMFKSSSCDLRPYCTVIRILLYGIPLASQSALLQCCHRCGMMSLHATVKKQNLYLALLIAKTATSGIQCNYRWLLPCS